MSSIIVLLAVTRLQQTTDVEQAADMAPTGFVSFSGGGGFTLQGESVGVIL